MKSDYVENINLNIKHSFIITNRCTYGYIPPSRLNVQTAHNIFEPKLSLTIVITHKPFYIINFSFI